MYRGTTDDRIMAIRRWVKKKYSEGQRPDSDDIRSRIEYNYAGLSEAEQHYIQSGIVG